MHAVHVFWTLPYRSRGIDLYSDVIMGPAERLVAAASALLWQMHSGSITLYTDQPGYEFMQRWGIADVWSNIDTDVLMNAPPDVDAAVFWDFGKTLVLSDCTPPFALLDLDLIVWHPLKVTAPVQFFHWEELEEPWYPPFRKVSTPIGYCFPDVDSSVRPGNTALLYIDDIEFKGEFVARSLAYATNNHPNPDAGLSAFLFSGQRLFTLIGAKRHWLMQPFVPYVYRAYVEGEWVGTRPAPENPLSPYIFLKGWPYMHLWGLKHELRRKKAAEQRFANLLIEHVRLLSSSIADRLDAVWTSPIPSSGNHSTV